MVRTKKELGVQSSQMVRSGNSGAPTETRCFLCMPKACRFATLQFALESQDKAWSAF